MDGFPQYADIILFAMIAGFLILRLRSVLGRRTGNERQRDPFARRVDATKDIVSLPNRRKPIVEPAVGPAVSGSVAEALGRLHAADPGFDATRFVEGARGAFAIIVAAFAQGDKAKLRQLLSDEVFEPFGAAVDRRKAAHETLETRIVAPKQAEIVAADLDGRMARVTMKFVTDQINVTRAADGSVVDGDPEHPIEKIDFWTFERDTRSPDPNWLLVATNSA